MEKGRQERKVSFLTVLSKVAVLFSFADGLIVIARTTLVGSMFRDCLGDTGKYKSSAKAKTAIRAQKKKAKQEGDSSHRHP